MLIYQGVFHPIYIYIYIYTAWNVRIRQAPQSCSTQHRDKARDLSKKSFASYMLKNHRKKKTYLYLMVSQENIITIIIIITIIVIHIYVYIYIHTYIHLFIYLYTCINPLFLDIQFSSFNRHRFWVDSRFQPSFRSLNPQQGSSW